MGKLSIAWALLHPLQRVAAGGGGGSDLSSRIGEHNYWCFGPCPKTHTGFFGPEFNVDTIVMTWIVIAIILGLALLVRRGLSTGAPRGVQNLLEYVSEFINNMVSETLGAARLSSIGPLAVALFLFILISNYIGLIPLPFSWWHSPTSDINTTMGLALMVFIIVQSLSVGARGGGGYIGHYFQPYWWLFPINIIEEFSKPFTLAFRLFGNIFAGEVLTLVLGTLLGTGIALVVLPFPYAALGVGLGLFVGGVQAFIFTNLTVSYIGIATATEGH